MGRTVDKEKIKERIAIIVKNSRGLLINNRWEALDYMWKIIKPVHTHLKCEALVVVYLRKNNKIIDTDVRIGDADSVSFPTDEITAIAIRKHAKKVVLAHNHPETYTTPSDEDVYHCSALYISLYREGIDLLDDLVVANVELRSTMNTLRFKEMIKEY